MKPGRQIVCMAFLNLLEVESLLKGVSVEIKSFTKTKRPAYVSLPK